MHEYWYSSLLACEKYLNSPYISVDQTLFKKVPNSFKEIRPCVKYGWEMILIVHEIIKTENPLKNDNKDDFFNNYHQNCQRILNENSWIAEDLQKMLDQSRKYQIDKDFDQQRCRVSLNIFHRPARNYANILAFHRLLLHRNQIEIFFEKTPIEY